MKLFLLVVLFNKNQNVHKNDVSNAHFPVPKEKRNSDLYAVCQCFSKSKGVKKNAKKNSCYLQFLANDCNPIDCNSQKWVNGICRELFTLNIEKKVKNVLQKIEKFCFNKDLESDS